MAFISHSSILQKRYPYPNLHLLYGASSLVVDEPECDRRIKWLYDVFPRLEYWFPKFSQFMQVVRLHRGNGPLSPPLSMDSEYFAPFMTHPAWYDEE